jgi:3-deoxy-D-arabino-heptulosonate 7-phosphate (DAHP) synthase
MARTVIRTQPINLAGLWRLKILLPEARELLDIMGDLRRTGTVEKDEHILDTLDELTKETKAILTKKGISLTVEDFLKERER